jgi:hypothetical protein
MSVIVNIKSLDTSLVKISSPVKVDSRFHSKIKYNDEKMIAKIESCRVVDIKKQGNARYISFKLDDSCLHAYMTFEENIMDRLDSKSSLWDDIDVYDCFKKNIQVHKVYGCTLCIKAKNDDYDEYLHKTIDLYMRPNMIKSVNKNIFINWQVSDIKYNNDSLFVDETDCAYDGVKDNVLGPYDDDIKIKKELVLKKIQEIEDFLKELKESCIDDESCTDEDSCIDKVTEIYIYIQNYINKNI